jgi:DNA-directed RNA polymerase specialized sigma24 family protein
MVFLMTASLFVSDRRKVGLKTGRKSERLLQGLGECYTSSTSRESCMGEPAPGEVTQLLLAWSGGEGSALEKLIPLVYAKLRRLAHRYMRAERADHTLQTSALINEVYLRLIDSRRVKWQDRAHFLAISSQLMRRVLVDFARSRASQKRGGDQRRIPLDALLDGGLSTEEIALTLSISPETVLRDWKLAKLWLLRALKGNERT